MPPAAHPPLILSLVFSAALLVSVVLRYWLATRQARHVARHRHAVPAAFAGRISLSAHQKAADYTLAKLRLGLLELALGAAVLLGWTLLGGLDSLNRLVKTAVAPHGAMAAQLVLLVAFALVNGLLELPLSVYQTFGLEQRFGFNHMTGRLWLADLVKSAALGLVIGLPLAAMVLWLMGAADSLWWLWTWVVWMGFNLLLLWLYPTFIAPWFNRFEPLQDEALRSRVSALMARCGLRASGLFVMDGSRRSAHANAYFTGFGTARRVVFFDTLLQQLSATEVEAVLAHELGHFRHRHILWRLLAMAALSLAGLALLGWLSTQAWFYAGLGVMPNLDGTPNDALALLLFMLVTPVFGFFLAPLMASLSRRHEFEADAFAAAQTSGAELSSALLKLYEDNAATLTPDPLYVRVYYSHPPAAERLARLAG